MNRYLVYQAFGPQDILNELVFSIYSVLEVCGGLPKFEIIVYTDHLAWLQDKLPDWITRYPLPRSTVDDWAGPKNLTNRIKLKMLTDFMGHHSGTVLYADSDTRFLINPTIAFEKIESGYAVLYNKEGQVSQKTNLHLYKLDNFLKEHPEFNISTLITLYSDAIIGLQTQHLNLIQDTLALTDKMNQSKPPVMMEPLAISWMISRSFEIETFPGLLYHYAGFKEFTRVLTHFFTFYKGKPWEEMVSKIKQIEPSELQKPKLEYENLPIWQKTIKGFQKEPWKMPPYTLV